MNVAILLVLLGAVTLGVVIGLGLGWLTSRGHHRAAGLLVLGVIVLGPAVVAALVGGGS